eukprot:PhM_4_TR13711/c0_g1_i1/m.29217/K04127/cefD; isopenicillin-N epimerase
MIFLPKSDEELEVELTRVSQLCKKSNVSTDISPRTHRLAQDVLEYSEKRRAVMFSSTATQQQQQHLSREEVLAYMDPWILERQNVHNSNKMEVTLRMPPTVVAVTSLPMYGAELRKHFYELNPTQLFTNAGSYGATPTPVIRARADWELVEQRDPILFRSKILPARLRHAANIVCANIGANPADFTFMVNANAATSTVLKAMPWCVGDKILALSCDYSATLLAFDFLKQNYGVERLMIDVVLPISDDEIVTAVRDQLLEERRAGRRLPVLANFCHITSKSAWIFPVKRLVAVCHEFDIPVMIDGAQAAGHLDLDVSDINADYYLGTVHKWMCSCQGVAFLVTHRSKQAYLNPLTITSSDEGDRSDSDSNTDEEEEDSYSSYSQRFYAARTPDIGTWLSVIQADEFINTVLGGWHAARQHMQSLAQDTVKLLLSSWAVIDPTVRCLQHSQLGQNCLPIVMLPRGRGSHISNADATKVMGYLLLKKNITAMLVVENTRFNAESDPPEGVPTLGIRITCQYFLEVADMKALASAILELEGDYGSMSIVKESALDASNKH